MRPPFDPRPVRKLEPTPASRGTPPDERVEASSVTVKDRKVVGGKDDVKDRKIVGDKNESAGTRG